MFSHWFCDRPIPFTPKYYTGISAKQRNVYWILQGLVVQNLVKFNPGLRENSRSKFLLWEKVNVFLEILFGFLEDKKIVSSKITSEILSCKVGSKNMG